MPIILIYDYDNIYNPSFKMSKRLNKEVFEFNADFVCVLDIDEFITSDNCNPQDILKTLDHSFYYGVKWITYISTSNDENNKFIPKN